MSGLSSFWWGKAGASAGLGQRRSGMKLARPLFVSLLGRLPVVKASPYLWELHGAGRRDVNRSETGTCTVDQSSTLVRHEQPTGSRCDVLSKKKSDQQ